MKETILKTKINSELIVLSCLMQSTKHLNLHINKVKINYFVNDKNKAIFKALKKIHKRKLKFNVDTLDSLLDDRLKIDQDSIYQIIDNYKDAVENIDYHIEDLKLQYVKFKLYNENLNDLDSTLLDKDSTYEELKYILNSFDKELKQICSGVAGKIINNEEAFDGYIDTISRRLEGLEFGETGFDFLNEKLTEGFSRGKLTVLAAFTSMGKTVFLSNLMLNLYLKGLKVAYFCFEPSVNDLIDLMVCNHFSIKLDDLIKEPNNLGEDLLGEIEVFVKEMFDSGLITFIEDTNISFEEIEKLFEENNYHLAIFDLWEKLAQIETGDPKSISGSLDNIQQIAKRTLVHCILAQQINREAVKDKKDRKPKLYYIQNSSKFEQVCDNALLLHREKYFNPELIEDILEIIVAKQRKGKRDFTINSKFVGEHARVAQLKAKNDRRR